MLLINLFTLRGCVQKLRSRIKKNMTFSVLKSSILHCLLENLNEKFSALRMRSSVKIVKDENTDQNTYYFRHSSLSFHIKMYAHHQNLVI